MRTKNKRKICTVEGCENPAFCRGWCRMHHQRWRCHGDPNWLPTRNARGEGSIVSFCKNNPEYKTKMITVHCPFRNKTLQMREHHWIAEQRILRRKLHSWEAVHHIDENPLNNYPDNLKVMTKSDHIRYHNALRHLHSRTIKMLENGYWPEFCYLKLREDGTFVNSSGNIA